MAYEKLFVNLAVRALAREKLDDFLSDCLEILGKILNIEGVFLWKYNHEEDAAEICSQWMAEKSTKPGYEYRAIPACDVHQYMDILKQNQIVNLPNSKKTLNTEESTAFNKGLAQSILLLPLFIGRSYYGIIALEAYETCRNWTGEEKLVLKSAGRIISKYIGKNQKIEKQQSRLKLLKESLKQQALEKSKAKRELKREIKKRKKVELSLGETKEELKDQQRRVREINIALSVMQKRKENEISEQEERISRGIMEAAGPIIKKLKESNPSLKQMKWLGALESNLKEITAPMAKSLTSPYYNLTPSEIKVASLVRQRYSTKEIAELMGIAPKTVETHRLNMRKKLGIANTKQHLISFLLSLK